MIPPLSYRAGAKAAVPAYVYLLRSETTGLFYLGWTTSLQRRLDQHNGGANHSTRSRGPWELLGYETHASPETARRRERFLKRQHRMRLFFVKRALAGKGSAIRVPKTGVGGPRQVGG